jgi:hypothetical protein
MRRVWWWQAVRRDAVNDLPGHVCRSVVHSRLKTALRFKRWLEAGPRRNCLAAEWSVQPTRGCAANTSTLEIIAVALIQSFGSFDNTKAISETAVSGLTLPDRLSAVANRFEAKRDSRPTDSLTELYYKLELPCQGAGCRRRVSLQRAAFTERVGLDSSTR